MDARRLVDSHVHLTDFEPEADPGEILLQAFDAGVSMLVCDGSSEGDWSKVLELSHNDGRIIPFLGLHPWFVNRRSASWLEALEQLVSSSSCGIGEIGLDRKVDVDESAQRDVFVAQLRLAARYDRPVTIHCRQAWDAMMEILAADERLPRLHFHAFSGSSELIPPLVGLGAYFSFSGNVLMSNNRRGVQSLRSVPPDRLLIETDAPALPPPEAYRTYEMRWPDGRVMNHPANLVPIAQGLASLLNETVEDFMARVWNNSCRFLGSLLHDTR